MVARLTRKFRSVHSATWVWEMGLYAVDTVPDRQILGIEVNGVEL
jgi:hypothetical protein